MTETLAIEVEKGGSKKNNSPDVIKRIGVNFHKELEEIKDQRLIEGLDMKKISNQKLTNQLIKHEHWNAIKEDLTYYDFEE